MKADSASLRRLPAEEASGQQPDELSRLREENAALRAEKTAAGEKALADAGEMDNLRARIGQLEGECTMHREVGVGLRKAIADLARKLDAANMASGLQRPTGSVQ